MHTRGRNRSDGADAEISEFAVPILLSRRWGRTMSDSGDRSSTLTASELQRLLGALRRGVPVLHYRDADGALQILPLVGAAELVIGRRPGCDLPLVWSRSISRVHAVVRSLGDEWTIEDDGLSHNGTYVNGARIASPRRLADGDAILVGSTVITYRTAGQTYDGQTETSTAHPGQIPLTPAQRRVLTALCRPMAELSPDAGPASNRQIATELFLSVETVKTHMRALATLFSVDHLPQNQRRYAMAHSALRWGIAREGSA